MIKKKIIKLTAGITTVAILLVGFGGCGKVSTEIKVPQASLETQFDNSIPLLTGDNSKQLLNNLDRGFRMETYYTLGSGASWPGNGDNGIAYLDNVLASFEEENPLVIQAYFYLTEYYDKPLDEKAFEQLKAYLERLKEKNLGVIFRFAYAPDQPYDKEPTQDQLLSHIEQIKEWMAGNRELINDTVTSFQMGILGAWGEWGGTQQKYNRKKIAIAICDMIPKGMHIQGRYMDVTKLTKKATNSEFVGYHNDFMVARPHPWNTAGDKNNSSKYKQFEKTAMYRMNDGEMPWVSATQEPNEYVDGKKFIQQCYEHHLSTLSIEHNYKEVQKKAVSQSDYNIARWKTETITASDLKEMGCPYYDSWFQNSDGTPLARTIFEYLQDFLGYQLLLSNLKIQNFGTKNTVAFTISNVGLAAPLTIDNAQLVVKNKTTGAKSVYEIKEFDPLKLTTYGQLKVTVDVNENLDNSTVGVAIMRNKSELTNRYVKCANNVPFESGANIIVS